jgi:hypothetical protein
MFVIVLTYGVQLIHITRNETLHTEDQTNAVTGYTLRSDLHATNKCLSCEKLCTPNADVCDA